MIFSARGSWRVAQKTLAQQARKALGLIKPVLIRYSPLPPNTLLKVFDTKILPVVNYGSELWCFENRRENGRESDILHHKFCKWILRVHHTMPNNIARGELGRHSLIGQQHARALKYWTRLTAMPDTRLTKAYIWQLGWCERNITCWTGHIRKLLCSYGFGEVWYAQGISCNCSFFSMFRQRTQDKVSQTWGEDMYSHDRFRTYRIFKT